MTSRSMSTHLSPRELEVLQLAAGDLSIKQIGTALGISGESSKSHLARIYRKLGVGTRTGAVLVAARAGLIKLDGLVVDAPKPPVRPQHLSGRDVVLTLDARGAETLSRAWCGRQYDRDPELFYRKGVEALHKLAGTELRGVA